MRFFIIAYVFYFFSNASVFGQRYIGRNGLGSFELLNDSTCVVSFLSELFMNGMEGYFPKFDTCNVVKDGKTYFLTSKKPRSITNIIGNSLPFGFKSSTYSTVKFFTRELQRNGHWRFLYELSLEYEEDSLFSILSIGKRLTGFSNVLIVIVEHPFLSHRIFFPKIPKDNFGLKVDFKTDNFLILDSFPIIVKSNKVIPIDNEKNFQCWVDNGFYFPKMRLNKNYREHDYIPMWKKGITGLRQEIVEKKKMRKRK